VLQLRSMDTQVRQIDAGAATTRHLLARSRRSIFFGGAQLDERVMQRLYGWRKAIEERRMLRLGAGVAEPRLIVAGVGQRHVSANARGAARSRCHFFCNDNLAQGALMAAMRQGVTVPGRVAVAGFNDLTGSDQMLPTLPTVSMLAPH